MNDNRKPDSQSMLVKPRRPLSAYNLYLQLERERILSGTDTQTLEVSIQDLQRISRHHKEKPKRKHRKSHGKISFLELARTVSSRWRDLSSSEKHVFEVQALVEKQEYLTKMNAWKAHQSRSKEDCTEKIKSPKIDTTVSAKNVESIPAPKQDKPNVCFPDVQQQPPTSDIASYLKESFVPFADESQLLFEPCEIEDPQELHSLLLLQDLNPGFDLSEPIDTSEMFCLFSFE